MKTKGMPKGQVKKIRHYRMYDKGKKTMKADKEKGYVSVNDLSEFLPSPERIFGLPPEESILHLQPKRCAEGRAEGFHVRFVLPIDHRRLDDCILEVAMEAKKRLLAEKELRSENCKKINVKRIKTAIRKMIHVDGDKLDDFNFDKVFGHDQALQNKLFDIEFHNEMQKKFGNISAQAPADGATEQNNQVNASVSRPDHDIQGDQHPPIHTGSGVEALELADFLEVTEESPKKSNEQNENFEKTMEETVKGIQNMTMESTKRNNAFAGPYQVAAAQGPGFVHFHPTEEPPRPRPSHEPRRYASTPNEVSFASGVAAHPTHRPVQNNAFAGPYQVAAAQGPGSVYFHPTEEPPRPRPRYGLTRNEPGFVGLAAHQPVHNDSYAGPYQVAPHQGLIAPTVHHTGQQARHGTLMYASTRNEPGFVGLAAHQPVHNDSYAGPYQVAPHQGLIAPTVHHTGQQARHGTLMYSLTSRRGHQI